VGDEHGPRACERRSAVIPPSSADFWRNADRGRFYKPLKQQITARIDADVLEWLKSSGKGYQSRINAILRKEMLAALKS